jgi:transposase
VTRERSGGPRLPRWCGVAQTSGVAERVQVRELSNDEGRRLLSIVRRASGSVVRLLRAQMVLWSAQRMDVPAIAKIAFTSEDRVRAVIHNYNEDGFDSRAPKYAGGRPPTFTLAQRREIKKVALSRPVDHDLPFSTWSLSKLAEFLVAEGGRRLRPRGPPAPAPRGRRLVSGHRVLQGEQRPAQRQHSGQMLTIMPKSDGRTELWHPGRTKSSSATRRRQSFDLWPGLEGVGHPLRNLKTAASRCPSTAASDEWHTPLVAAIRRRQPRAVA